MAFIDLTNLSELLAQNPDIQDMPGAIDLPKHNSQDPDVAVEFDNVVFNYPTQPENTGLKGLSFKMKKGTTTAIVGSTVSAHIILCILVHTPFFCEVLFHASVYMFFHILFAFKMINRVQEKQPYHAYCSGSTMLCMDL